MANYSKKLQHPKWQKKRLRILERDCWTCQICKDTDSPLHVHHRWYEKNREPWDYPDEALTTLCEKCHDGGILNEDKETLLKEINQILSKLTNIELNKFYVDLIGTYVYLIEEYDG